MGLGGFRLRLDQGYFGGCFSGPVPRYYIWISSAISGDANLDVWTWPDFSGDHRFVADQRFGPALAFCLRDVASALGVVAGQRWLCH